MTKTKVLFLYIKCYFYTTDECQTVQIIILTLKLSIAFISLLLVISSCGETQKESKKTPEEPKVMTDEDSLDAKIDSMEIESDIDMSLVDDAIKDDFLTGLKDIEDEYGKQWPFCTCAVKNDSINKAFQGELSDVQFSKLSDRFDVIDKKCKAFITQNPNQTPEDRAKHEKKVRDCLKAEGIYN